MEEMLQRILDELNDLKDGQNRIEKKLDSVYEHTAKITENITESNMKINKVCDDIDFIKHKEQQS